MTAEMTDYGFQASLDMPCDMAVEAVTAAMAHEGFCAPTELEVPQTLKEICGPGYREYIVREDRCGQPAHESPASEADCGPLPCTIVVREVGERSLVSVVDPISMLASADNGELEPVALAAHLRLRRIVGDLAA